MTWCTHDVVDFIDLIELVVAGEEREEGEDLKEHAASAPDIHFIPVVAVC